MILPFSCCWESFKIKTLDFFEILKFSYFWNFQLVWILKLACKIPDVACGIVLNLILLAIRTKNDDDSLSCAVADAIVGDEKSFNLLKRIINRYATTNNSVIHLISYCDIICIIICGYYLWYFQIFTIFHTKKIQSRIAEFIFSLVINLFMDRNSSYNYRSYANDFFQVFNEWVRRSTMVSSCLITVSSSTIITTKSDSFDEPFVLWCLVCCTIYGLSCSSTCWSPIVLYMPFFHKVKIYNFLLLTILKIVNADIFEMCPPRKQSKWKRNLKKIKRVSSPPPSFLISGKNWWKFIIERSKLSIHP